MIGLAAQVLRLIKVLSHGFKNEDFRALTLLTFGLILSGSLFYTFTEGWRFLDALYFSVATLTTVGYGDLTPKSDIGKIFTIVYILGGVGVILAYINMLADYSRRDRKQKS